MKESWSSVSDIFHSSRQSNSESIRLYLPKQPPCTSSRLSFLSPSWQPPSLLLPLLLRGIGKQHRRRQAFFKLGSSRCQFLFNIPISMIANTIQSEWVTCRPTNNESGTRFFGVNTADASQQASKAGLKNGKSGDPRRYYNGAKKGDHHNGNALHFGIADCDSKDAELMNTRFTGREPKPQHGRRTPRPVSRQILLSGWFMSTRTVVPNTVVS